MNLKRLSFLLFFILCALCAWQGLYYFPQLPDTVASHFGLSGQPDSWSGKTSFITMYFGVTGIVAILFSGVIFGMSNIPVSFINLPNKEYWLSEAFRQQTFDFMSYYFSWFASATQLLMLDMFHQIFLVHLGKADALTHHFLSIGFYMVFSVLWVIGLYVRFPKK